MRKRILKWLACPICSGELKLLVSDFGKTKEEIVTGALTCHNCKVYYPIAKSIPRMLTYKTEVAEIHAKENCRWICKYLKGYNLPDNPIPKGELSVLNNFSNEWAGYEWTGKSFWGITLKNRLKLIEYELGISKNKLRNKLFLEVGMGIGFGADALASDKGCEVIGVDLSYAVDQAQHSFGKNPRLHIVQASVFFLPFKKNTFDIVYSHGVLHHTYSTHAAFNEIAKFPKNNGGMLYVWIYSSKSEEKSFTRRLFFKVKETIRPLLSKLPNFLTKILLLPLATLYIFHQNFYLRKIQDNIPRYGLNEAVHAARDRFTQPFAYRHSYKEVAGWFVSNEYSGLKLLKDENLPNGVPETYSLNIGIRGFKN